MHAKNGRGGTIPPRCRYIDPHPMPRALPPSRGGRSDAHPRRSDMRSRHQGNYWIGTFERGGDKPQGTLTSVAFKVTHPWASFLVGGGPWPETCVELVRADTKEVFYRASGL